MLGNPVVRCLVKYNSPEAKKCSDEDAEGLQKDYSQCVDFKRCVKFILLFQFIVIDFLGLVNGCQGIVKKICYLPGSDVHNLLSVVFVQCNRYSGRELICAGFQLFLRPGGMT